MSSSEAGSRESFPLIIERPSEDVAIEICNAFDQIVAAPTPAHRSSKIQDTSRGQQIRIQVPRGLYFVRSSLGGESQERVVRVSGETKVEAAVPIRSTSAAYQGVESSHEYYSYPAAEQSRQPTTRVLEAGPMADSWLFLFVRARDKEAYAAAGGGLEPAASGWHLETPQGQAIPLAAHSVMDADGWLALSARAPAGDYKLHDLGDEPRTMAVTLYPRWQTQLFVTFDRRILPGTWHVSFAPPERGFQPHDDWARAVDLGLSVLASGRGYLPVDAQRILLGEKFENPMLGLIAAWTILQDFAAQEALSQQVLDNLNGLLPDSPDVAVLRVAQARRFRRDIPWQPIRRTPMLRAAAAELISVATEHPEILSAESILDDVSPRLYVDSAFTCWRPIDSELPAALRLDRSTQRLSTSAATSAFEMADAAWVAYGDETEPPAPEQSPVEDDSNAWLQEAVAEVIQLQAGRRRAPLTALLDIAGMAKRTGVTPQAVRQALEAAPLENQQIALSLSDPSQEGLPDEFADDIVDATKYLARTLIAAGASLAYGGDFRKSGYTRLLAELINTYNQTATRPAQALHSYLGAPIPLGDVPPELVLVIHHLVHSPDVAGDALMPPPSATEQHAGGLYFSDMRRVMAKYTAARLILGGQPEPRQQKDGPGYRGRYPGVVEDAWRTLEAGKPLYVIGGFGGAAAMVADLLEGQDIPSRLRDETFAQSEFYQATARAIDNDPYQKKLGLPLGLEDLAQAVRDFGLPRLKSDGESTAWNGLTLAENRTLFRTRDAVTVTELVLKGLVNSVSQK